MAHSRSWFSKHAEGKIVTLTQPVVSSWEIISKVNERVDQHNGNKQLSIASAKFLCHHADAPPDGGIAYMRIVKQIPSVQAENTDDLSRAKEARYFVPDEFKAYQTLMRRASLNTPKLYAWQVGEQNESGLVPGGAVTWIVFEKVEGFALGDGNRATAFWDQPQATRETIRKVLVDEYNTAWRTGVLPMVDGPQTAIWNEMEQTIRFVGFRNPAFFEAAHPLDLKNILEVFKIDENEAPIDLSTEDDEEESTAT